MSLRLGTCVGVTNSRLNAAKRGIAVEIGARIAVETGSRVCLVGADPTDRDIERHFEQLVTRWGPPTRMEVIRGTHHLEFATFERSRVCVVSVSDRESIELVLPTLQQRFEFIVIDAPSRAGDSVGIADVLLDWLDALVVATSLNAGDLAETRHYVEHVGTLHSACHVNVRVIAIGDPADSGLSHDQLAARLAMLPMVGHVPRPGRCAPNEAGVAADRLGDAFVPIIRWIVEERELRVPMSAVDDSTESASTGRHVANRLYREVNFESGGRNDGGEIWPF